MLTELSIRNFAIIDELKVSFADGLNVLPARRVRGNRLSSGLSAFSSGIGLLQI